MHNTTPDWRDGIPFILAVALISVIGLYEFYRGVRKTGAEPQEWVGLASAFLFLFAARQQFTPSYLSIPGVLTFFVLVTLTVELLRHKPSPIKNLGTTFLGAVYVGWLSSYLVAIRSIGKQFDLAYINLPWQVPLGAWLVVYVVFCTWAADTGAFLVGRKWGKHKLAPTVSPGKSWEGWFAGVAACLVMSFIMGLAMRMPWYHMIILGIGISIVSVIGDLAESAIKRDIGIKDFGSVLPGHGGMLDRFDGLLFAAPIFYYYMTIILRL